MSNMAEQQRIPGPYGDVFLVNTPTLDKIGQQLYLEQKQRSLRQQQENAQLDANIQKEIGKVRSVDTPEVINSYNQYKQLRKELLFNKQLQKDPLAYNQLQQEANRAYQNIFSTANKSAEVKEMSKNLTTDRIKNPDVYSDDFGERMSTLMNTPISGLNHPQLGDLTNWDNYRYQGSNTDFGKMLKEAIGPKRTIYGKETPIEGGLQFKIPSYEYNNTPGQVKDYLLGSMGMHRTGRDAAFQWNQIPESEIENTIKQYQALPKEYWERIGLSGPQDLMPKNPDNKAENFAAYQAMKYAIANEPREGKPEIRENKGAVLNWQLNKDKIMEGLRHGNRMAEISFRESFKNKGDEEQNDAIDDLYDNLKADAVKNRIRYKPAGGEAYDQYLIKATEGVKKLFATTDNKGHLVYPDQIRFSKDFGTVTPIFFEHYVDDKGNRTVEVVKDKNGNVKVEADLNKPILETEFKERWKKEIMGAGAYGKTLKNKSGEPRQTSVSVSYKINGKPYSHKELNDMGYDDNEIDQAIKAGIISK